MILRSKSKALRQQQEQSAAPDSANAPSVEQDPPTMDEDITSANKNDKTTSSKSKAGRMINRSDVPFTIPMGPVQPITATARAANITPGRRTSRISADLSIARQDDRQPSNSSSPSKPSNENDDPIQSELTPRRRSMRIAQALQDNNGRTMDNGKKDVSPTARVFNDTEYVPQPDLTPRRRSQRITHALQDNNGRAENVNKSGSTTAELLPNDSESVAPDVNLEARRNRSARRTLQNFNNSTLRDGFKAPAPVLTDVNLELQAPRPTRVQAPSWANVEENDICHVRRSQALLPWTTAQDKNSDPLLDAMMRFLMNRPRMDSDKGDVQPASGVPANPNLVVQPQSHIEGGGFNPVTSPEEVTNESDVELSANSNAGNLFGLGYGYGYYFPQTEDESFFDAEFAAYEYAHGADMEDSETDHVDSLLPLGNELPVETAANVRTRKKEESMDGFIASIVDLNKFEN